jgi:hypothetical protein
LGGLSRPFGRGVGARPEYPLRVNYDYAGITITALRKSPPHSTRAPGLASGATARTRAAFRPDGAMIEGSRWPLDGSCSRSGAGRAVVPLRTPQNGSGGFKTGYGGGAPMQAPAVQPGRFLFAQDRPPRAAERPRALQANALPALTTGGGAQRVTPSHAATAPRAPHHRQVSASPRTRHTGASSRPSGPPR